MHLPSFLIHVYIHVHCTCTLCVCVCVCWQLWRVSDGSVAAVLRGHRRGVWSVKFSPVDQVTLNLRILIVCTIYCVNQRSANRILNPSFPLSLTHPPTLQCVLTASGDTTLKLWAVSDGSCIKTFEGHTMSVLKAIFLSRGMQIVSRYVHVYTCNFLLFYVLFYILHSFPVVLCSGSDGLVKIWTLKTSECVATLDLHTEKARLRPPYCPILFNTLMYMYIHVHVHCRCGL